MAALENNRPSKLYTERNYINIYIFFSLSLFFFILIVFILNYLLGIHSGLVIEKIPSRNNIIF